MRVQNEPASFFSRDMSRLFGLVVSLSSFTSPDSSVENFCQFELLIWQSLDKLKHYISTTTMSVATKLSGMMTYGEGLSLIKSQDHLNT